LSKFEIQIGPTIKKL